MTKKFLNISLVILMSLMMLSCGIKKDIETAKNEKYQKSYDVGYKWAKEHSITDKDDCARFMNFASKSPELEGCIDFHSEYLDKKREIEESGNKFNEEGAPEAPVEEPQIEESCDDLTEFCTN